MTQHKIYKTSAEVTMDMVTKGGEGKSQNSQTQDNNPDTT